MRNDPTIQKLPLESSPGDKLPSLTDWRHHAQSVFLPSWGEAQEINLPTLSPRFEEISVTPDELIPLLKSLDASLLEREDVLPVCLSDFDGTLTSGASGSKIFEYGASSGFFLEDVRPQILDMLKFFSLEPIPGDSVGEEFLRILATFRTWSQEKGLEPDLKEEGTRKVYKMLSWIYAGHTRDEVHAFAERAFRAIDYDDYYLQGARELVNELTKLGVSTAIISVKFQPILEVAARYFSLPSSSVVGMNLEVDQNGRFTTEIKQPMTFREGKDLAARGLLQQYMVGKASNARPLLAMGDSPAKSDQQMLEMAHIALYAEPQTSSDAEYARGQISKGRRALIVDYQNTVGGESVTLFDRSLEVQSGPQGRFL
jgi:phosphoserine phosphatase